MNDLEDRLRTGLHDLADTVPASPHARADLDRRLTRRGWRVPVLVATAAAAVVAAVAVPVLLSRGGEPTSPAATSASVTPSPSAPTGLEGMSFQDIAPRVLGRITEDGVEKDVELFIASNGYGGEGYCVGKVRPAGFEPEDLECERVPVWPVGPAPGMLVLQRELYGEDDPTRDTGPLPDLMLFVTAPQVTKLDVGRHDGAPVPVSLVARMQGATLFLADFDGPKGGLRYTARDAAGNVVESAIE